MQTTSDSSALQVGYLGPEGTFTEEALLTAMAGKQFTPVPLPTIYDAVLAVHSRSVDRSFVPIENSLEGTVAVTLDALAFEAKDVTVVGEIIHPVRHCLIAKTDLPLDRIEAVLSHPQATAQCSSFLREKLPRIKVLTANSTAEAVKTVGESELPWAALGNRLAADIYGCKILESGVENSCYNETRFVWLAQSGTPPLAGPSQSWKTSLVFWGAESTKPGWLVECLSEFSLRSINLTKIESRPRKEGLGSYMFFVDLEGRIEEEALNEAVTALSKHSAQTRVLGSYRAAQPGSWAQ